MSEWAIWGFLIASIDILLASWVTIHAVLWKRDSRAVIGWVGLAWLAPFLGACAYLILGINRIERKAGVLKQPDTCNFLQTAEINPKDISQLESFSSFYPNMVGLARAGKKLTGFPLLPGNNIEPLIDGDQAYPAMIDAINGAQQSVALLSYIFDSDQAGERFFQALVEARKRGVAVRVLIDDVGSKYSVPNMVGRLKDAGLNAASFLPTKFYRLPTYANLRNHRKILVVDGKVGFTGGTNIREDHWRALQPKNPVQCLHFKLEGPVVSQLHHVFAKDWAFACGEDIGDQACLPDLERVGEVWTRSFEHGPDEHFEKLPDLIVAALAGARQRVRILTPYFLPNPSLIQALNVAVLRGAKVEIYLPSTNNIPLVHWAASAQLWQILEKGCRVYYTQPPFDHTKLMIVDDLWTLLGSTNWDPRSLRLNFEFNVECFDENLAKTLNQIADRKALGAHEVTLEEVNARPFPVRLRDGLARLLTPYL